MSVTSKAGNRLASLNPPANSRARSPCFTNSSSYWLACLCFGLGLMSKTMLVTWPLVLLLLDYWPLQRFQPRSHQVVKLIEKIPSFALATAGSVITFVVQKITGAVVGLDSLPFGLRIFEKRRDFLLPLSVQNVLAHEHGDCLSTSQILCH